MTSQVPQESTGFSVTQDTYSVTRGAVGSTLAEPPSFINVREVQDWCKECREYKPSPLSATTLLAVCLGAIVGFLPALAATDRDNHGVWWGIFLLGSILAGAGCIIALLAMVIDMPRVRQKLHLKERQSPHDRLANRMDGACQAGLLRATAAEKALQREEEQGAKAQESSSATA